MSDVMSDGAGLSGGPSDRAVLGEEPPPHSSIGYRYTVDPRLWKPSRS